jgi:acyl-CoA synthetase (NDP forming)
VTADEFIGVVGIALDEAREEGSERERRRIRRAIMYPRNALVRLARGDGMEALGPTLRGLVEVIDDATRAPRKGKRK